MSGAARSRPELDVVAGWVRVLSIRSRLLAWYDRTRRDLPWRRDRDPYRVLVSELMLQQTRVDVAVPYFERWTALWPDFASLAAAQQEQVLAAWSGLGYYRRARWLHEIAKRVVADHGGRLPDDPDALRKLPGVGAYTAAAIASIAYARPVAVVDGNVERVLCRVLGLADEPGAERLAVVREAARRLVTGLVGEDPVAIEPPEGLRPGDMNQAIMELGAVVCTPLGPDCPHCPIAKSCVANRAGLADEIPLRRDRRTPVDVVLHAAVLRHGERFLLVRRPEGALLSGLWEVPTTREGETFQAFERRVGEAAGRRVRLPRRPARTFRHTITHRRITVEVHEAEVPESAAVASGDGVTWIRRVDLRDFGASSMTKKALAGGPDDRDGARSARPAAGGRRKGGGARAADAAQKVSGGGAVRTSSPGGRAPSGRRGRPGRPRA